MDDEPKPNNETEIKLPPMNLIIEDIRNKDTVLSEPRGALYQDVNSVLSRKVAARIINHLLFELSTKPDQEFFPVTFKTRVE